MRINPNRLALARQRRGLNKTELALGVGVTPKSISLYEKGDVEPSTEVFERIAETLAFPQEFFLQSSEPAVIVPSAPSFRALSTMTAGRRDAVLAAGALAIELNTLLTEHFELPVPQVPDLRDEDPEAAAEALRAEWRLGERPIKNMVHLLEARGIRVFSLAPDNADVDAFTVWHGETPFVFLNTLKSAERGRYDAAHELGHLVLHRHGEPQGREAENEANRFASALLMPKSSVIAHAPRVVSIDRLARLKKKWGVSVGALARRLSDLRLITDWQYRHACIEISRRGWRKNEPYAGEREKSQIAEKVIAALRAEDKPPTWLARQLHITPVELNTMMFGLVPHALDGGRQSSGRRGKPQLRLI